MISISVSTNTTCDLILYQARIAACNYG